VNRRIGKSHRPTEFSGASRRYSGPSTSPDTKGQTCAGLPFDDNTTAEARRQPNPRRAVPLGPKLEPVSATRKHSKTSRTGWRPRRSPVESDWTLTDHFGAAIRDRSVPTTRQQNQIQHRPEATHLTPPFGRSHQRRPTSRLPVTLVTGKNTRDNPASSNLRRPRW